MCDFCNLEVSDSIYKNEDGNYCLEIETNHWDDYMDCFDTVELKNIKFCPYCGRDLIIEIN